jgi:hypothetical protein
MSGKVFYFNSFARSVFRDELLRAGVDATTFREAAIFRGREPVFWEANGL